MTIGIVFVNYFSADLIAERVTAYGEADVMSIVVDNSGDYHGPGIVVGDGTNIGFGSACNLGVDTLDPSIETVILHNPDVRPSVEVIEEVARRVRRAGVGIVAPALETPDGLVSNGYSYPRLSAEIVATRSNWSGQHAGDGQSEPPSRSIRSVVRTVSRAIDRSSRFGSAALLAVDVEEFRKVGGFDDRFILYGEDLDFWHRVSASGAEAIFANDLLAFHERGGGSPASRQTRELLRFAGIQLFTQVHSGDRWKQFRAIHRRALGAVGPENKIGQLLTNEWSAQRDPIATSSALRACFLEGAMADPGSNNGRTPRPSILGTDVRS